MTDVAVLADVIRSTLVDREIEFEEAQPGAFLCKLPGSHKLSTMTWLVVGQHSLHVEAFFVRQPDENHAAFYRWLLERNARMFAVSFAVDNVGDVYLTGRLPLVAVTAEEIDRILGSVLTYSDEWFDKALELGFRSSIEREWDWRVKRGESLRNLEAFAKFADPANREHSADPADRET
ncbi:MAG TPA: YbjN domain-containing protein [Mycobacteriales bacterium]|nr:YbjN domain-containing protein [Mycobacteriales bacterium]